MIKPPVLPGEDEPVSLRALLIIQVRLCKDGNTKGEGEA